MLSFTDPTAESMNDNMNIDSTIVGSMNDNINMDSTIAGSMNDNINMEGTIAGPAICLSLSQEGTFISYVVVFCVQ
jgi:hypothetical protein